jgi:hypothetical protein
VDRFIAFAECHPLFGCCRWDPQSLVYCGTQNLCACLALSCAPCERIPVSTSGQSSTSVESRFTGQPGRWLVQRWSCFVWRGQGTYKRKPQGTAVRLTCSFCERPVPFALDLVVACVVRACISCACLLAGLLCAGKCLLGEHTQVVWSPLVQCCCDTWPKVYTSNLFPLRPCLPLGVCRCAYCLHRPRRLPAMGRVCALLPWSCRFSGTHASLPVALHLFSESHLLPPAPTGAFCANFVWAAGVCVTLIGLHGHRVSEVLATPCSACAVVALLCGGAGEGEGGVRCLHTSYSCWSCWHQLARVGRVAAAYHRSGQLGVRQHGGEFRMRRGGLFVCDVCVSECWCGVFGWVVGAPACFDEGQAWV